jgi:hypothetical protein
MLGDFHASLLPITFLLTIAVQENVPAQVPHFSDAFLFDVRITQSGKPVAVRIADPFARLDQERALLKFLNEPHTYGWDSQTTVSDIGRDVGKHIALRIDHRALEEIGLTADELVFPKSGASAKKKRPARTPTEDPFADHPAQSPATFVTSKSPEQHWWDRKPTTTPAEQMTNAAVLFHGLSNADLVIATWSGRWLITTDEAAEENLSTRLYDVTPIADIQDSRPSHVVRDRMTSQSSGFGRPMMSSGDALIDVVQTAVDPNTWEVLGGPSTCRAVVISGRTWLVMSTPVTTHWKVQALLNQLNGS